jgi:hypothetical protein
MSLTNDEYSTAFQELKGIIEEFAMPKPLKDYILMEVKAVCEQSSMPYDDITSIIFHSASTMLAVSRKMVILGNKKRNTKD